MALLPNEQPQAQLGRMRALAEAADLPCRDRPSIRDCVSSDEHWLSSAKAPSLGPNEGAIRRRRSEQARQPRTAREVEDLKTDGRKKHKKTRKEERLFFPFRVFLCFSWLFFHLL